jgi:hypothetical protein
MLALGVDHLRAPLALGEELIELVLARNGVQRGLG